MSQSQLNICNSYSSMCRSRSIRKYLSSPMIFLSSLNLFLLDFDARFIKTKFSQFYLIKILNYENPLRDRYCHRTYTLIDCGFIFDDVFKLSSQKFTEISLRSKLFRWKLSTGLQKFSYYSMYIFICT